jgi:hypothetical protein
VIAELEAERDAILTWSIRHAGYISTRMPTLENPNPWWARGDGGSVYAMTAIAAVRRAAGLNPGEDKS